jgi:membrane protease YdiL (CAAX protease family)
VLAASPEIGALLLLHRAARRRPRLAPAIVLCGFGLVRLACLPLRLPLLPAPALDPAWIALAWIAGGAGLQGRLGSASEAREWIPDRAGPLGRALALMLGVWLLFPLAGRLLGQGSGALLAASLLGAALVAGVGPRPRLACPPASSLAAGLLAGWIAAGLATAATAGFASAGGSFLAVRSVAADPQRWLALGWLVPVLEEALYRERLLSALRAPLGAAGALLASSALFALTHDPAALPFALAGGLVCGVARLGSGGIALPVALHAGWNQGVLALSG